jgi:hypothetical protein
MPKVGSFRSNATQSASAFLRPMSFQQDIDKTVHGTLVGRPVSCVVSRRIP